MLTNITRRMVAVLLAICLCASFIPASVLAATEQEIPRALQNKEPVTSKRIADYGKDSFLINANGSLVLKDWQADTETLLPIQNAKNIAVTGSTLVVLQNNGRLMMLDIPSKEQTLIVNLDAAADKFAVCDGKVYYSVNKKLYQMNLSTKAVKELPECGAVEDFYLYDIDVLAYQPPVEDMKEEENRSAAAMDEPSGYLLLFLKTGEIVSLEQHEAGMPEAAKDYEFSNYSVRVGNETMPFPEYPDGSKCPQGIASPPGYRISKNAPGNNTGCDLDHYYIRGKDIDMRGSQCMGFADMAFYRVFGFSRRTSQAHIVVADVDPKNISVNYLKSIFGKSVLPGAHIRTNERVRSNGKRSAHSLCYMGFDDTYVYSYECNWTGYEEAGNIKRTWADFINFLTLYNGIYWIAMPRNYPGVVNKPQTQAPVIKQESYIGGKTISFSAPAGATVYYTTDGSVPTETSRKYISPFVITTVGDTRVRAVALQPDHTISMIAENMVSIPKLPKPAISSSLEDLCMRITITSDTPNGTIHYTTDGYTPTVNSPVYHDSFVINANKKIQAIVVREGCINSDIAVEEIRMNAPGKPKATLLDTPEKIPVGNAAKVHWTKQPDATSYNVTLKRNGEVVDTQKTTDTLATFMLDTVGQYEITVEAVNFVGSSEASYPPLKVEAMAPCKVEFRDWDGALLSRAQVAYGGVPVFPKTPVRVGYTFAGWNMTRGEAVYKDTVVTAQYEIKTYIINYYDVDGRTLLHTEKANYGTSVKEKPDASKCHVKPGYAFSGWSIKPESEGTSFEFVDGNIDAVAGEAWENPNLPVYAEISKAYRTKDGNSYELEVVLTSKDAQLTRGRIVAVLKTDQGKTVASQIADTQIPAGNAAAGKKQSITINYAGKARNVEVMVVGIDENGNTGGAYSEAVSARVQSEMEWEDWSEWTETQPSKSGTMQVQKKVQTRQRTAETTTSDQDNLSGWTKYNTEAEVGSWTEWSRTKPSDAAGRKIESRYIEPTYKTQYRYRTYRRSYDNWTHFCPGLGEYNDHVPYIKVYSEWMDSKVEPAPFGRQSCPGGFPKCDHNGRVTITQVYRHGLSYYFEETRKAVDREGYNEYRYQDTSYTYYYYRYSAWSDWADQGGPIEVKNSANLPKRETELRAQSIPVPSVETQTRTLYRSRKQFVSGDADKGEEDTKGQEYHTSGKLADLNRDYNGHTALILVYQRTNSDPTAEKLQYVGHTQIGAGNSYDFRFRPKEDPSTQTEDFVVSLALEGASRIVNVDVKPAPKPEYSVKFVADGKVLNEQRVKKGEAAQVPAAPEKKGYIFVGWDEYTTNVDRNLTITAEYIRNEMVVVKVDFANDTAEMVTYLAGDLLGELPVLKAAGKHFKGWYTYENGQKKVLTANTVVEENMIIYADWEPIFYTVTFMDTNENVISEQRVEHGKAAQIPDLEPKQTGMEFMGWSMESKWWNVTSDIVVWPVFSYVMNTEDPNIEIETDADTLKDVLHFNSSTPDAKIYYDIEYLENKNEVQAVSQTEGMVPEGFTAVYSPDKPVEISEDVRVKLMAEAPGKNASAIVTFNIEYSDPMEPVPGEGVPYRLLAENAKAKPGELVDVPLYITAQENIQNLTFSLKYDKTVLQLVKDDTGIKPEKDNGAIWLRTLQFKVLDTAKEGRYPIEIEGHATDSTGKKMDIDGAYLEVEVKPEYSTIIAGEVRSYDPGKPVRIELRQKGVVVQTAEIPAGDGTGAAVQRFEMKAAQPGVYDLVVKKDGHLDFMIRNLNVQGSKVELTTHENPAIRQIRMIVGDLDANSVVDKTDLNILWNGKNFNQNTGRADNPLADLNADGIINREDMSILWNEANYNKSVRDCTVHY